jgi:hypothetical protein
MKILLAIGAAALLLTGCASTTKPIVNQTQIIVYEPPTTLFNCPQVTKFPTGPVVTNRDVANTIEKLYSANRTCGSNMNSIQNSIEEAKKIYQ